MKKKQADQEEDLIGNNGEKVMTPDEMSYIEDTRYDPKKLIVRCESLIATQAQRSCEIGEYSPNKKERGNDTRTIKAN